MIEARERPTRRSHQDYCCEGRAAVFCGDVAWRLLCLAAVVVLRFTPARAQDGGAVLELMQQATTAQRNGDTSTAIQLYRKVLQQRPHWGPAEYNLGLATLVAKQYAAAVELFDRALSDDPSLIGAYLFRGITYYNLGDVRRAVSSLKRYSDLQPQDPEVHYYLAGSYFTLQDYPAAAVQYVTEIKFKPHSEDVYYYLGHCYLAMAREIMKNLSHGPDGKYYTWLILGEREADEGNTTSALQNFRQAMRLNPQLAESYVDLGNLLLKDGQPSKAKADFEEALKHNRDDCSAFEGLGDTELAMGNLPASLAYYRSALHFTPGCAVRPAPKTLGLSPSLFASRVKSLEAYAVSRGWARAAQLAIVRLTTYEVPTARQDQAKVGLVRARAKPTHLECAAIASQGTFHSRVDSNLFLASCRELNGDVQGATSALVAAERNGPVDKKAAYQIADIEMGLSQWVLSELARSFPNSYWLIEMRGEWLETRGKYPEADSEYREAAMLSGVDPTPLIEYARFKCKLNELDQAKPILEKALALAPDSADANALLGYVYFSKNLFGLAIPCLRIAVMARSTDEQSRIYLAESLANLHDLNRAVAILEKAPSDTDGRIHYVLAGYYRELGRKPEMEHALAFFSARQQLLHDRPNAR
jgi:tetratricopeptide (TPR) repeat protein